MYESMKRRATSVAVFGATAALTVGGVALAQGRTSTTAGHSGTTAVRPPAPPAGGPGGPLGPLGPDLTYAELHVRRDGKEVVIRVDRGEVVSASSSSITVKENDSSQVTTAVDSATRVLAGPGRTLSAAQLKSGTEVVVSGPEGSAATQIALLPPAGAGHPGPVGRPVPPAGVTPPARPMEKPDRSVGGTRRHRG